MDVNSALRASKAEADQRVSDLKQSVAQLQGELESAHQLRLDLQHSHEALGTANRELESAHIAGLDPAAPLAEEHRRLQTYYSSLQEICGQLQSAQQAMQHKLAVQHGRLQQRHEAVAAAYAGLRTGDAKQQEQAAKQVNNNTELPPARSILQATCQQLQPAKSDMHEQPLKLMEDHAGLQKYEALCKAHSELENAHTLQLDQTVQLADKHRQLQADHNALQDTCSQLQSAKAAGHDQQARLAEQLAQLQQRHAALSTAHGELDTAHAAQTDQAALLADEHNQLKADHTTVQGTASQLQCAKAAMHDQHARLAEEHRQLQQTHGILSAAQDEVKTAHAGQQEQAAQLADTLKGLQTEYTILQGTYRQLQSAQAATQDKHVALSKQYECLKQTHGNLTTVHTQLKTAHTKQLHQAAQLAQDHKRLQTDHSTLQGTYSQLRSAQADINDKHVALSKRYECLQQSHEDLSVLHGQLETVHSTQLHQAAHLAQEHRQLQVDHTTLLDTCIQLQSAQAAMSHKHVALSKQHEQLQQTYEAAQQAASLAQIEQIGLQEQLTAKDTACDVITTAKAALSREHSTVCRQLSLLQAQHEQLLDSLTWLISQADVPSVAEQTGAANTKNKQMKAGVHALRPSIPTQAHSSGRDQQALAHARLAKPSGPQDLLKDANSSAKQQVEAYAYCVTPSAAVCERMNASTNAHEMRQAGQSMSGRPPSEQLVARLAHVLQDTRAQIQAALAQKAVSDQQVEHFQALHMAQCGIASEATQLLLEHSMQHASPDLIFQPSACGRGSKAPGGDASDDMDQIEVAAAANAKPAAVHISKPQPRAGAAVQSPAPAGASSGCRQAQGAWSSSEISPPGVSAEEVLPGKPAVPLIQAIPARECQGLMHETKGHEHQSNWAQSQESLLQKEVEALRAQQREMAQDLAVARSIAAERFDILTKLQLSASAP